MISWLFLWIRAAWLSLWIRACQVNYNKVCATLLSYGRCSSLLCFIYEFYCPMLLFKGLWCCQHLPLLTIAFLSRRSYTLRFHLRMPVMLYNTHQDCWCSLCPDLSKLEHIVDQKLVCLAMWVAILGYLWNYLGHSKVILEHQKKTYHAFRVYFQRHTNSSKLLAVVWLKQLPSPQFGHVVVHR